MNEEIVERLENVEMHIAHLERQMDELNEVLVLQSEELERVKKLLGRVTQSIQSAELERIKSVDSKPPHYQ
ncbi:MAG: SlyX family protein [Verrucomicrobiota bacterium]